MRTLDRYDYFIYDTSSIHAGRAQNWITVDRKTHVSNITLLRCHKLLVRGTLICNSLPEQPAMKATISMNANQNSPLDSFMSSLLTKYGDTPLSVTRDNARSPLIEKSQGQRFVITGAPDHALHSQNRWDNASPASFRANVETRDLHNMPSPPENGHVNRWASLSPGGRDAMVSPSFPSRKKEPDSGTSLGGRRRSGQRKPDLSKRLGDLPY